MTAAHENGTTLSTTPGPLTRPSAELALWLRDLRRASGLSLATLATRTGYSRSVLGDACSGRRVVTLPVLEALVAACGGDEAAWAAYWRTMRRLVDEGDVPAPRDALRPSWVAPPVRAVVTTEAAVEARVEAGTGESAAGAAPATPAPGTAAPTFATAAPAPTPAPAPAFAPAPAPQPAPGGRRRLGSLALLVGLVVLALAAGGAVGAAVVSAHGRSSDAATAVAVAGPTGADGPVFRGAWPAVEKELLPGGVGTYKDPYRLAQPGPRVGVEVYVEVSCKVFAPSLPAAQPDGYWYRLRSSPWDDLYYAPANAFLNGDPEDGPRVHATDDDVPDC